MLRWRRVIWIRVPESETFSVCAGRADRGTVSGEAVEIVLLWDVVRVVLAGDDCSEAAGMGGATPVVLAWRGLFMGLEKQCSV